MLVILVTWMLRLANFVSDFNFFVTHKMPAVLSSSNWFSFSVKLQVILMGFNLNVSKNRRTRTLFILVSIWLVAVFISLDIITTYRKVKGLIIYGRSVYQKRRSIYVHVHTSIRFQRPPKQNGSISNIPYVTCNI